MMAAGRRNVGRANCAEARLANVDDAIAADGKGAAAAVAAPRA